MHLGARWLGAFWLLVLAAALASFALLSAAKPAIAQPQSAFFFGEVFINGESAPAGTRIEALINGQLCGEDRTRIQDGQSVYLIELPPEPGCGEDDAVVEFFVNGVFATSVLWFPGDNPVPLGISGEPTATPPPATPTAPPATPTPPPVTPVPTTPPPSVVPSPTGVPCPGAQHRAATGDENFLGCGKAQFNPPADTDAGSAVHVRLFVSTGQNPILVVQGSGGDAPGDVCSPPVPERDVAVFQRMSAQLALDAADFSVSLDGSEGAANAWLPRDAGPAQQLEWDWTIRPSAAGEHIYEVLVGVDTGERVTTILGWRCTIQVADEGATTGDDGGSNSNLAPIIGGIVGGVVLAGLGVAAYMTGLLGALFRRGDQPTVFLSYRRSDTAGWVGRINEHLSAQLGHDHVFMDVIDIEAGADWMQRLDDTLTAADALIVLIGPRWVGPNPDGTRRIDNPRDWVRVEAARGLARPGVMVIPALVEGASLSALANLPPDLQPLLRRNAIEISQVHFDADMKLLVRSVRSAKKRKPTQPTA